MYVKFGSLELSKGFLLRFRDEDFGQRYAVPSENYLVAHPTCIFMRYHTYLPRFHEASKVMLHSDRSILHLPATSLCEPAGNTGITFRLRQHCQACTALQQLRKRSFKAATAPYLLVPLAAG